MYCMAIYVYQVIEPDGSEGETFEVFQMMSDPPLTHQPATGKQVRRVFTAPSTPRKLNPGNLSNSNLERLGFTKYEKRGTGTYEKTAGGGPNVITRQD
jgi:hypothetical protein